MNKQEIEKAIEHNDEYNRLMKEYGRLEKLKFQKEVAYAEGN